LLRLYFDVFSIFPFTGLVIFPGFTSQADLKAKILAFVDYFNRTLAKPFKWNYTGKPLVS
jgi:hypothetical protein